MFKYEKPIVLEYEDVAEGIYAASGDIDEGGETGGETGGGESGGEEGGGETGGEETVDYENDADCWIRSFQEVQRVSSNPSDSFVIYQVKGNHKTNLKHISSKQRVTMQLSSAGYTSVDAQGYPVNTNGTTVEFTRELLGDAYHSGDEFTVNVRFSCPPEVAAELRVIDVVIYCTHAENVQGGFD
jgi:hypothetical protein